jgi:hypothetical protein
VQRFVREVGSPNHRLKYAFARFTRFGGLHVAKTLAQKAVNHLSTRSDQAQILNSYVKDVKDGPLDLRHSFDKVVWVDVPDIPVPKLPVGAIDATIHVSMQTQKFHVCLDHLVAYCFRDVLQSNTRFLAPDGSPLGNGGKA